MVQWGEDGGSESDGDSDGGNEFVLVNPAKTPRPETKMLTQQLADDGNRVSVVIPKEAADRMETVDDADYVFYDAWFVPGVRYPIPLPSFFTQLFSLIGRADVAFVTSYIYLPCLVTTLFTALLRTPCIVSVDVLVGVRWSYGQSVVDSIAAIYTHTVGRCTFALSDHLVVPGEYMRTELTRFAPAEKITVIPNGIDVDHFTAAEETADGRERERANVGEQGDAGGRAGVNEQDADRRAGVNERERANGGGNADANDRTKVGGRTHADERVNLLFVGRLAPVKNIPLLLRSVKRLRDETGTDYDLTIVGDGEERERYETLAKELELSDAVRFEGFRSNVREYYRDADVLVLTSVSEGFPTVLMEAQACGLPVVTTDVGGAREIVAAGSVVSRDEPGEVAEAITSVVTSDSEELRSTARRHVEQQYSQTELYVRYRDIFQEQIGSN
ncbi:glycosyltransferase family 4 protein [Haladaptatus sp. AB643]|uniref:glycosyltransferase family 4 protein n=1 Tax=Haladaptatus sp. AB643 TaxID=2934174 RepID=UPI00209C228A|nr:glycosyltransferase family 4 protein [Haladaptatus sp. AB643]MCO8246696.1 glycosyltransferase family 4 protein [Haladaptatus sp. AB643]